MKKNALLLTLFIVAAHMATAQLGDMLKRKAADGVKQGSQTGTEKAIDKGIDNIFKKKDKKNKTAADTPAGTPATSSTGTAGQEPSLKTYSKYDFVAGEKVMGFDDFSQDAVGDFPGKWTTNASGEIMTADQHAGKWLNVSKQGYYIPSFIKSLPDNFTLEYDVLFIPPASSTGANTATLGLQLVNAPGSRPSFDYGIDRSYFELDPYMNNVNIAGYTKTGGKILANEFQVKGIQRQHAFTYHIAVWRQKSRLRVYLDETKVVDAPSILSPDIKYNGLRFCTSLNNDGSNWLISNFKFATGLPDTRNKLLNEGKFSTTGILFNVNTATIRAESYGTLKEIATVLKENAAIHVKITGHTDSDGDNESNLALSRKRADAVKALLAKEFSIDESRMQTDGKGETQPVAPNTTAEGKAQNRRVEFTKQ
jgi:outer membrane protein OmpA-like peptidoglycan-associated protein